jgi:hypothetical protein
MTRRGSNRAAVDLAFANGTASQNLTNSIPHGWTKRFRVPRGRAVPTKCA